MIHTVSSLNQLLIALAEKAFLTTDKNPFIVQVDGVIDLKDDKATSYPNYYATISEGDSTASIVVPKKICEANEVKSGQYVRATGRLELIKSKNQNNAFEIRLIATSVDHIDSPEKAKAQSDAHNFVLRLLSTESKRNPFPLGSNISVHVVLAKTSDVKQDFENAIKSIKHALEIQYDFVDITSSDEVSQAIQRAKAQVLLIIRGGGSDQQFAVFSKPSVISALLAFPGYRILAVGHAKNKTISDYFCDFACDTPTAAGYELTEKLLPILSLYEKIKQLESVQTHVETVKYIPVKNNKEPKGVPSWFYVALIILLAGFLWFKK